MLLSHEVDRKLNLSSEKKEIAENFDVISFSSVFLEFWKKKKIGNDSYKWRPDFQT